MKLRVAIFGLVLIGLGDSAAQAGRERLDPLKNEKVRAAPNAPSVVDGLVLFDFSPQALDRFGLWFTPRGNIEASGIGPESELDLVQNRFSFAIDPSSEVTPAAGGQAASDLSNLSISTCGALMLFPTDQRVVIGNLTLERDQRGVYVFASRLADAEDPEVVFYLDSILLDLDRRMGKFVIVGDVVVAESWAIDVGAPEAANETIGGVRIEAAFVPATVATAQNNSCLAAAASDVTSSAESVGPDVIVGDLQSTQRYTPRVNDITAYAVGTTSCNVGTQRVNWHQHTNQHPVIIQNLYRLDNRGFQQIGMSWMKHGFYAISQSLCTPCADPTDGTQLGVGCSDPYSAPLNGDQSNMTPRSTLNAHTGSFPYPWSGPGWANSVVRRVQVHDVDINPALNPNSRYFIEGHYLTADDASAGNADNNASYREVTVANPVQDIYDLVVSPMSPTRRGQAAVRAWKDVDSDVVETDVRVPGEGLMILAAKAMPIAGGWYRYQYALQNLNSDRSARAFKIQVPAGASMNNIGFRDIDHHSGEPFATTDWSYGIEGEYLAWVGPTYEDNVNANALRYGSVFSFWFDCDVEPAATKAYIGLFKPGFPADLAANTIGPRPEMIDCNENQIQDACDLDCNEPGCVPPCGAHMDCDANGVPDECQQDCDSNGVADTCDIADCAPDDLSCADCNANTTPDRCEVDCDLNQIPDDCLPPPDTDGDGWNDCFDLCPTSTPAGGCQCPQFDRCCFRNGTCIHGFPRDYCIELGGTPDCFVIPCLAGCLLGDADDDGDLDLVDYQLLQTCFSGEDGSPSYLPPAEECAIPFDFAEDGDIDLADFSAFYDLCSGPGGE